jgi:hypothetical protein
MYCSFVIAEPPTLATPRVHLCDSERFLVPSLYIILHRGHLFAAFVEQFPFPWRHLGPKQPAFIVLLLLLLLLLLLFQMNFNVILKKMQVTSSILRYIHEVRIPALHFGNNDRVGSNRFDHSFVRSGETLLQVRNIQW